MNTPLFKEDHISQVPALQLLVNLGYTYLTPEEAQGKARQGWKGLYCNRHPNYGRNHRNPCLR